MTALTWGRFRDTVTGSGHGDEGLRRVALRLAAQTVALLLVMLIALEVVVYAITQRALFQSLENTLRDRAAPAALLSHGIYEHDRHGHVPPPHSPGPSDASAVYLNLNFQIVGGDGPIGTALLDPATARQTLHTGREHCCDIRSYSGQDYLLYTSPVVDNGSVVGVVQTSISANQYEHALGSLRQTLLLVALLGLLISGAISAVLVGRALRPIRVAMKRQRDFVADAAHELRTPLSIMRTVGELGMAEASTNEHQATLEQILIENRHLTRLVDDLSLLARADSQVVALQRAPLDLAVLVRETVAELSPLAEEQDVRLVAEADERATVMADMVRMRQLLLILLDNALKHTPAGGSIRVTVRTRSARAQLEVADTGSGIPPADLPRIFDRFYRADQARTGEGSGLGLAIGEWIVSAHGGQIQAANAPDHGAVFTVTLPLRRTSSPVMESVPAAAP